MQSAHISAHFDGGNIDVLDIQDRDIQLAIRKDNASDFYQWFYFCLQGTVGESYQLKITNCADSAYPGGWENYHVCASYDRQQWFRSASQLDDGALSFSIELKQSSVYFAYFAPYSFEQHLDLLAWAEADTRVSSECLGQTLDGRDMQVLEISETTQPDHIVWMIARQHPGETMAEWFVEGFLQALLDEDNPLATQLLQFCKFYVVPNMNPDGSVRGNLRTNAAGANLNREWLEPSMERSPEVYLVREKMLQTGGQIFLDIHGDEALPYNFVAGSEGTPNFSKEIQSMQDNFKHAYESLSPDFQTQHGYPIAAPGKADLRIATNWLGNEFKTLSFTLEMPFKDNANLPNPLTGWSPERSAQLGKDILYPIAQTLSQVD